MRLILTFTSGVLLAAILFAFSHVSAGPCDSSMLPLAERPGYVDPVQDYRAQNPPSIPVYPAFPSGARSSYGSTGGQLP